MGDPDNGDPLAAEAAYDLHEVRRLALGERRGGLVEDEDPRLEAEGLRHLHQLLLTEGQALHQRLGGHLQPDPGECPFGDLLHGCAIHETPSSGFAPEHDVLLDAQVVAETQLLVDQPYPDGHRVTRTGEGQALAVQEHLARVRSMHAGQHPHQRALPRAVLTHEGKDLAPVQGQRDVLEGPNPAERLGDPPQLQQGSDGLATGQHHGRLSAPGSSRDPVGRRPRSPS